ncbi:response regulator [Salegentibacter sp. JZCK2]|uniref:response regulator n=1 Tax=Salegentibacter tibetensis TaxID=2873600 RepID=UPI001CCF72E7|nr:response regulator [Salegentibacter tibetensis]MBZ9728659.1 response regulator [Salegentibacter tibetensis]
MKILIIEDDAVVAIMQKMWIAKTFNYKAELFSNGLEAVNFLDKELIDKPDETYLILLDLNMPVMNGWEFLEALEQRDYSAKVSVIVVTSSKFREDYEKAKESPLVIDFLNKPIGPNSLKKFIKEGELQFSHKKME